jgi:hypothetical protein
MVLFIIKRERKRRLIYECRCDQILRAKADGVDDFITGE